MQITEVNLAQLGNVLVTTRTSDNMRLEVLDRAQIIAPDTTSTSVVPASPKRGR